MQQRPTTYSFMARYVHWINALLLIIAFASHELMHDNPTMVRMHIIVGTVALVTTILQGIWYLVGKKPAELPALAPWRDFAIKWNHRLLIITALLASATGFGLTLGNGLGLIPALADLERIPHNIFYEPHEITSYLMMLLLVMHVAGVLLYQFTKGNTLGRMAPLLFGRKS